MVDGLEYQVYSLYVKASESKVVQFKMDTTIWSFDVSTGVKVYGNDNASITYVSNDWYRVVIKGYKAGGFIAFNNIIIQLINDLGQISFVGDGVSGIYIWGRQLEEGSSPTSYIPTAGTQVTRAADNCDRTLGDEYNASEGTVYCELTYPLGAGSHRTYGRGGGLICRILAPSGSGFTNQFVVYRYRDTLDISFRDASRSGFDANTLSSGLSIAEGVSTKIAVSWKASVGFTFAAAGVTGVATYTDLPPFASDSISLTTAYDGSKFGGIKKDFRILPIALSETELSALTGGA